MKFFGFSDIYNHVEIWDERHALQIYKILNDVLGDFEEYTISPEENKDNDDDDDDDDDGDIDDQQF